jgi:hypothetical protein
LVLGGGCSSYFHLLPHAPAFSDPHTVDAWAVLLRQKTWQGTLTLGQREDMSRGALNGGSGPPQAAQSFPDSPLNAASWEGTGGAEERAVVRSQVSELNPGARTASRLWVRASRRSSGRTISGNVKGREGLKNQLTCWVPVAHAYNPSYWRGRDQKDCSLRTA